MMMLIYLLAVIFTCVYLWLKHKKTNCQLSNLESRFVLITGCDTGFGNLLAKLLDNKGIPVFAGCFTEAGAEKLKMETSTKLQTMLLDVTDPESVSIAAQKVESWLPPGGGLWGLVNNAGVLASFAPSELLTLDDFEKTFRTNLFGTISMTLTFLPLIRQATGRIINVCSAASQNAVPGIASYCISKAGIMMFSACLRRELYRTGVTIHDILPGGFETNLSNLSKMRTMFVKPFQRCTDDQLQFYGGNIARYVLKIIDSKPYFSRKPICVAEAMEHALCAKCPKREYRVGLDMLLFYTPLSLLPNFVGDWLFGWVKPYGVQLTGLQESEKSDRRRA
ncbi:hypothetical protein ACJMK2_020070 [Sinanodonta woodiana]|uniref:Uncharacterized protein n=1 Tax=Sinanodonta woodiana TaxID=1069815 RepID=A0ABD3TXX0_SINWO